VNAHERKRLDRLDRVVAGILVQMRLRDKRLHERCDRIEQAILELDAALRRSGVLKHGSWALSLRSCDEAPDRQSADVGDTVST
jgi:hypothetical protein